MILKERLLVLLRAIYLFQNKRNMIRVIIERVVLNVSDGVCMEGAYSPVGG